MKYISTLSYVNIYFIDDVNIDYKDLISKDIFCLQVDLPNGAVKRESSSTRF